MEERSQRFTKVERSWILYDWANSVYATIMMAALFPIYFTSLAGEAGDVWWGVGSSAATFIMAFLSPVAGAVADYRGRKKIVFSLFFILGLVGTFCTAITENWRLILGFYVLSNIGFAGSNLCYDHF